MAQLHSGHRERLRRRFESEGLDNFAPVLGITLPKAITDFTRVGMWGFYLPSQVLITLSVRKN